MSKKTNPGCFFLVAIPLTLISLLLVSLLVIALIMRGEYRSWEGSFEGNYLSEDFVYPDDKELKKMSEKKLREFSLSTEEVDFVELTTNEALFILLNEFQGSLPYGIEVEKGIVKAEDSQWDVYVKTKMNNRGLPWVRLRIEKDDIESAELFVTELYMGPYDLGDWGLESVKADINRGFTEALILVNENEFTGRRFENIELEGDGMIVKGRL